MAGIRIASPEDAEEVEPARGGRGGGSAARRDADGSRRALPGAREGSEGEGEQGGESDGMNATVTHRLSFQAIGGGIAPPYGLYCTKSARRSDSRANEKVL
jgi:hypothetical protein